VRVLVACLSDSIEYYFILSTLRLVPSSHMTRKHEKQVTYKHRLFDQDMRSLYRLVDSVYDKNKYRRLDVN